MISRQRFSLSFRQMLLQRHMCASLPPASGYIDADDHQHSVPCLPPAHVFSSLSSNEPMAYSRGWALQQVLLQQRLELRRQTETPNDSDQILMLQHSPVYTLGRGADENHLTFLPQDDVVRREALSRITRGSQSARLSVDKQFLVTEETFWSIVDDLSNGATPVLSPNNAPIYRIDRGGEVTFHGPGQLVVYPLLDLKRAPMKTDLHWYLRMVEEVIIQVLKEYDIVGKRNEINTGVWVGDSKLAAIGVSSSRWITTHGFAINVAPDLEYFDTAFILPCGIAGRGVTSIEEVLIGRGESESSVPSLGEVSLNVLERMQQLFGIDANSNFVEIPGTGSLIGHMP